MPQSLIRDTPSLEWASGQSMTVRLSPFALGTGRVLGDYSGFRLAIRSDPLWPRSGKSAVAAACADPIADGWPVAVTADGALNDDDLVEFGFVAPSDAGTRRYAIDVWATVGGGPVQLVRSVWLTVGVRVVPAS